MFPLTAITWRLGDLDSTSFEMLVPNGTKKAMLQEISHLTNGVYLLETCQRIILVIGNTDNWIVEEVIHSYFKSLGIEEESLLMPEIFLGVDALTYLAKVAAGLDSLVLGESEILHQIKSAYQESEPYMTQQLKTQLQNLIRVGKRVRANYQSNRSSTIEAVDTYLSKELERASSIGIFGTGKMGELIIKYYSRYNHKMSIYSGHQKRIGLTFNNVMVQPIDTIHHHDILFTATTRSKYINREFLSCNGYTKNTIIIDLGMPRNCDPEISELDYIEVVDIERLIELSDTADRMEGINQVIDIIEYEVNNILHKYQAQLRSKSIVDLRRELSEFADTKKANFAQDPKLEKQFSQFVNSLIHISQKHLERAILEESYVHD